jgi:hypothetical protein
MVAAAVFGLAACGTPPGYVRRPDARADGQVDGETPDDAETSDASESDATEHPDGASCSAPRRMCGTSCVDTSSDNNHCGSCGNACAAGRDCIGGTCQSPTCTTVGLITTNGTRTGTTSGSSRYAPPCHPAGTEHDAPEDVWRLQLPTGSSARTVTLATCGSTVDTILYVGTTCGGSTVAGVEVCNDDTPDCTLNNGHSYGSQVTFLAQPGVTYYVTVDAYYTESGDYTLTVSGL